MTTGFATAVAIMLVATLSASAQERRQSIVDLQARLRIGERIQIVDVNRTIIHGRFDGVSGMSLRLTVKGALVEILETDIHQVRSQRPEGDGVLVGLGIGAAVGLTYVRLYCRTAGEREDCHRAGGLVIGLPMAAVGALIDLAIKRFGTIFERAIPPARWLSLSPIFAGRHKGVVMTLTF